MMKKQIFALLLAVCLAPALRAEVRLAGFLGDNMVLQRENPVKIWGWADKGETVTVAFNGQVRATRADKAGAWSVTLDPMAAGGPYVLDVKGKGNALKYTDILVGDVWLCSGQSNMEWPVSYSANAEQEIAAADHPAIRVLNVARRPHRVPQDDVPGQWTVCSPQTVGDFSAVAYFFAREINRELGVPVGIINSSWGGTDIETWTSPQSYAKLPAEVKIPYDPAVIALLDKYPTLDRYSERSSDDPGMASKWYAAGTDDQTWEAIQQPQEWSATPLAGVDGLVWFRYTFDVPAQAAGAKAALSLGRIDDADITWINGVEVGRTNGPAANRLYVVPAGVLKAGRNEITVRVEDVTGPGGFTSLPEELFLEVPGPMPVKVPLAGEWKYRTSVINSDYQYVQLGPNSLNSLLYNGMIHPLKDFRIRGAIWYQGENNAILGRSYDYRTLFPNMIRDWRAQWGYEFPFYWVQLANFMDKDGQPAESTWAELREAQTLTLSQPRTGQAVIIDIGDMYDIHPRNKQDVGKRLALNAAYDSYGMQQVVFSSPTYRSMEKSDGKIVLTFNMHASQWDLRNKYGYIEGFAIAGSDQKFYWAKAELQGDRIVVWSDEVADPVAVRFAWGNNPDVNLFNAQGLPAGPFRTDDWKLTTQR